MLTVWLAGLRPLARRHRQERKTNAECDLRNCADPDDRLAAVDRQAGPAARSAAVISVYVLLTAATSMQRLPLLGSLPAWARRALILIVFTLVMILLFILVINNLAQVAAALPRYQSNLELLITRNASLLGIENEPTWENVRRETLDQVNIRSWVAPALVSLRGFGATLFLVVLYASFLIAERGAMARKVVMAMGDEEAGARAISLVSRINERIGQYLFVKTVRDNIAKGVRFIAAECRCDRVAMSFNDDIFAVASLLNRLG